MKTKFLNTQVLNTLSTLVLCTLPAMASAGIQLSENVMLSGFAAQSFMKSDTNPFMTDESLDGSADFREFSANINWQATPELRFHGQVISQNMGKMNNGEPQLDFLLGEYNYSAETYNLGVRLGRVKTPYGLFNASRDLPSARPGVFVPNSIYLEGLRDMMLSTDGVNLYAQWYNELGEFEFDAYKGSRKITGDAVELAYINTLFDFGDFEEMNKQGVRLFYRPEGLSDLQVGFSWLNLDTEFDGAPIFQMNVNTDFYLLSAEYAWKDVILRGEYFEGDNEVTSKTAPSINDNYASKGYYAQVVWNFHPKANLFLTHEFYELASASVPEQTTDSLGVTWNFAKGWHLAAQYSDVSGISAIPRYEAGMTLQEDWSYWGATLSYQF